MKTKNIILIIILMICLVLTSCQNTVQPDTPNDAAWLMKLAIEEGNYEKFSALFSEGKKDTISIDKFNEMQNLTTAGTEFKLYELLTFENGEMLLVRLTPVKVNDANKNKLQNVNGEYRIEDVVIVPNEMKGIFKYK